MNASEYKYYHESFMTNNHGSNAIHTFLTINFTLLSILLCCFEVNISPKCRYIYEYVVIVIPLVIYHTVFVGYVYYLNFILCLMTLLLFVKYSHNIQLLKILNEPNKFKNKRIMTITILRGMTYLGTVFCILAVDFRIFPRYLAKTERYGFSAMDTGVGLFILNSGLVHKNIRGFTSIFKDNFKLVSVLLVLGVSRFFFMKQLDYMVHITEYGVHWNFFYTLAVTKVVSSFLLYLVNNKFIVLLSLTVGIFQELLLAIKVQDWVFSSDIGRDTFLNANREGISSCLGYVSLYIFAVYLKTKINDNTCKRIKVVTLLLSLAILLWVLTGICNSYRPISRTLANLTYCFFSGAVFLSITLPLYICEIIFQYHNDGKFFTVPLIISAINKNGLLYFLFANLMTGLINLSIRTLLVDTSLTLLILNVYMITTLRFVVFLQRHNIYI